MTGQDGLLSLDRLTVPWTILPVRRHDHPFFAQGMPSLFPSHTLELDSRAELYRARIETRAVALLKDSIRSIRNDAARVQVDAVEQVVELGAELEACALPYHKTRGCRSFFRG